MGVSSAMTTGSGRAQGFAIFSERVFECGLERKRILNINRKYLM
jgi:hypothetical protein